MTARSEGDFVKITNGVIMTAGIQHLVTEAKGWTNRHGSAFTDWRTSCGKEGTSSGRGPTAPPGLLDQGRWHRAKRSACKTCTWPPGWMS